MKYPDHWPRRVIVGLCAVIAVAFAVALGRGFEAQANNQSYRLAPEKLVEAAQEIGLQLEEQQAEDTPVVIDFGGGESDAPIAGLDQWLAQQNDGVQPAAIGNHPITGAKKVVVLRVYFQDYANTSLFTQAQVQNLFDNLDQLWQDTSYGTISINHEVSTLFQLPDNRSQYIDDFATGDLSNGGKYYKVLSDAVANAPNTVDFSNVDAVFVLMAETDNSQFHRGQANKCTLPVGLGGANKSVGCGIFSENPSENANRRWGRWAHEMGHAFAAAGPAHPSNYNSAFELMDNSLPGQTGVFEKLHSMAFPGWLPDNRYVEINQQNGGESICLYAREYVPKNPPVPQAIKAEITEDLYYMISVVRRVNGDEIFPVPDEGVLIEKVSEGADPWVTVRGKGGDRNVLWQEGDTFDGGTDGIQILIDKRVDEDNYCVTVRYDKRANQPDVFVYPWLSPPANAYETTGIWIDSPINGYGNFRRSNWNDLAGNPVPRGNGDDPAANMTNRVYVRVYNGGTSPATDVKVHVDVTDPLGVGIPGPNGWSLIDSVDKNDFPGLANIAPGDFVDVYVEWTPNIALTEEQIQQGLFNFHSCLRVRIDPVAGETVLGNQDGVREQENISFFQVADTGGGPPVYDNFITLRNDDTANKKFFSLSYSSTLPANWLLTVNNGQQGVWLDPNEVRKVPVLIKPQGQAVVGSVFGVDVRASFLQLLENDKDPKDKHPADMEYGGARIEARVLQPVKIDCMGTDFGEIVVEGRLEGFQEFYDQKNPPQVLIQGVDARRRFIPGVMTTARVGRDGSFEGTIFSEKERIEEIVCLFAGTEMLASAGSPFRRVKPSSTSPVETPTRTPKPTWTPRPTRTPTPGPTPTPTSEDGLMLAPWRLDFPITINPVLAGDLSIHGIEITQGIQCFDTSKGLNDCPDNSLNVVLKKLTAARVYPKLTSPLLFVTKRSDVKVRLFISVNFGPFTQADSLGDALKVLDQSSPDNSANFIHTINGTTAKTVRYYAIVDPDNQIAESNESNNRYPSSGYVTMTFRPRDTLKIIGRPLDYNPPGYTGTRQAQGWAVNGGAATWFNQMLPIRDNGIEYNLASGFLDWTTSLGSGNGQHDLIEYLNGEYALLVIFLALFGQADQIPDHIYGWAPNAGYSGGHADMPVYPHAGGLGVVGIGTDRTSDGSNTTDDPGGGTLIFGHEMVHDYDEKHTDTGADDCGSNDSSSLFPYSTSSIQEFGFNPATGKVYDPADTHDLMSYCPALGSKEGWISPYTWQQMYGYLASSAVARAQARGVEGDIAAAFPSGRVLLRTSDSASVIVQATIQNPETAGGFKGNLNDLYKVDSGFFLSLPEGDYAIELRNGQNVLANHPFVVDFTSEYQEGKSQRQGAGTVEEDDPFARDPNPTDQVDVAFVVPWVDGTDSVVLTYKGDPLDTKKVSGNPPTVAFTDPTQEVEWKAGSTQKVSWKGDDADGDNLSYTLFYSNDGGKNWQVLATGLTGNSYDVAVDSLAGGPDTRFRIVASDGVNASQAQTEAPILVPNKAPNPVILEPLHNAYYRPGTTVVLLGSATDLEDGTIPDGSLMWKSDIQGELGVGPTLPVTNLKTGVHKITLTAMDKLGTESSTTVEIKVQYPLYLPSLAKP